MNFVFWLISSKGTSSLTRKTSLLSLVNLIYIQNVLKISRRWFLPFSKMINFYLSARLNKPFCINLVNRHPQNNFVLEITYIIVISTEFPLKWVPRTDIFLKMYFDHRSGLAAWNRWSQDSNFQNLEGERISIWV